MRDQTSINQEKYTIRENIENI